MKRYSWRQQKYWLSQGDVFGNKATHCSTRSDTTVNEGWIVQGGRKRRNASESERQFIKFFNLKVGNNTNGNPNAVLSVDSPSLVLIISTQGHWPPRKFI